MKKYTLILFQIIIAFSGTFPQELWERTNGLNSIAIHSLAINSTGDIFAGTDNSGLFRSTDNGISWTNLGFLNDWIHGSGIAIGPTDEIYVVTDNHFAEGGVMRSYDNGNNWDTLGLTFNAEITVALNSVGDIFAGTAAQGVYRSTDNGVNWVQINQGLTNGLNPTTILVNSSGNIFVGTVLGGVFRSTNNGDNWFQINQGLTNNYVLSLALNSNGDIFAGTSGGGVFRSTDNGGNWVQINNGLTVTQGLYVFSFVIDSEGIIFAGTADGVFRSTNNGNNWVQENQGLTNLSVLSLAINPNGDIFAGTQDGVFRTIPSANIKVLLQGPYASGSMSTTLNINGYIPLTQPYSAAPWNYTGTEAVATVPAEVVDWVLIDLRSNITTQVSRRAAFLMSDGSIVDLDGVSKVKFPGVVPGDYYVVIRHRNHLAVMTANPVTLSYSPVLYDFTTGSDQFYGGSVGSVQLSTSPIRWGMLGGDGNSSGIVTNSDKDAIINSLNNAGYYNGDTNFSGIVTNSDKDLIINNLNKSSSLP